MLKPADRVRQFTKGGNTRSSQDRGIGKLTSGCLSPAAVPMQGAPALYARAYCADSQKAAPDWTQSSATDLLFDNGGHHRSFDCRPCV